MLSTSFLIFVAFFAGIFFAVAFLHLDILSIKATNYYRARQRKQSAKRLLSLAFRD